MSILLTLLDKRLITFQDLTIFNHEGEDEEDNRTKVTWGYTKYTISMPEREVHLFLQHHFSDMHFMGTLLHELGHCFVHTFENGGHTEEWLQTTNKLKQIINHFIGEIPVLDSAWHELCVVSNGPNVCDKLVDSVIVLE